MKLKQQLTLSSALLEFHPPLQACDGNLHRSGVPGWRVCLVNTRGRPSPAVLTSILCSGVPGWGVFLVHTRGRHPTRMVSLITGAF